MPRHSQDLNHKTFGNWTVIEKILPVLKYSKWLCACSCGIKKIVSASTLITGRSRSCGCKSERGYCNRKFPIEEAAYRAKVSNYKSHAMIDNREWSLSVEEAICLLKGDCGYCGSRPSNEYNMVRNLGKKCQEKTKESHTTILYNGIDRIDSSKGYVSDNCVSCCKICNQAKMDMILVKFEEWIEKLIKFRSKK